MKTYKPEVSIEQTQSFFDNGIERTVHEAKLIFLKSTEKEVNKLILNGSWFRWCIENDRYVLPIIISETEEARSGEWALEYLPTPLGMTPQRTFKVEYIEDDMIGDDSEGINIKCVRKILALPKEFSHNDFEAIINGNLKENDKVLIKCYKNQRTGKYFVHYTYPDLSDRHHITLFPVKQSLETAAEQFKNNLNISNTDALQFIKEEILQQRKLGFKAGVEWAKNNF